MSPQPHEDLFIEPAGDYDVIYGDYNATMEDGNGMRPYLRLTSKLPNVTRTAGEEVRLKCEVAGTIPIQFSWLKNLAPLEKDGRVRVRNREHWSKLVITELDVLDSGYYQCTASNAAGSANTTSVLRVNPSTSSVSSSAQSHNYRSSKGSVARKDKGKYLAAASAASSAGQQQQTSEVGDSDFDYYGDEATSNANYADVMREQKDASFPFDVPDTAAGVGYAPLSGSSGAAPLLPGMMPATNSRWLDDRAVQRGECVLYRGQSCSQFLAGKYVQITSDNREDIYDIDRHLLASMLFIRNLPNVSESCKRYSHAVACYHLFKVCDIPAGIDLSTTMPLSSSNLIFICKRDCEELMTKKCPNELALAARHELVGDGPKALIPSCDSLPDDAQKCIMVLEDPSVQQQSASHDSNRHRTSSAAGSSDCYDGDGRDYTGTATMTRSFRQCLDWPQSTSWQFNTATYPKLKLARNQCRNPDGRRAEPFCYTSPLSANYGVKYVEESCEIPRCDQLPPNRRPALPDYTWPAGGGSVAASSSPPSSGQPPPPLLDSLSNVWRSIALAQPHQSWQLMAASGLVGGILLCVLLLLCCACCCRRRAAAKNRRGKSSGCDGGGGGGTLSGGSSGCNGHLVAESTVSTGSGSNIKKGMAPPNFSGGPGSMMGNGRCGSSSVANSDINYFQKMHDGGGELMNPLLKYNGGDQFGTMNPLQQQQQQLFELQQQGNYRWISTNNNGLPYPGHHHLPSSGTVSQAPSSQQQQQHFPPYMMPPYPPVTNGFGTIGSAMGGGNNGSSPHTSTEPPAEPYQILTIQEQQLKFDSRQVIGEDPTSIVYLGEWIGGMISGATLQVAIKTLKPNAGQVAVESFREEIKEIGPLEHINVTRLLGVAYLSPHANICAVFDYMIHGDLHEFLKVREPRGLEEDNEEERLRNFDDFLRICVQIAAGMEYIASCSFTHRDLATRNCLIADQQVIKIADFARMKSGYDHDYYKINSNVRIPLRWLSKEALNEGKYSQASDVYAFGITVWEIYTYGRQPFEGCTNQQVMEMINDGMPLEAPANCPRIIYSVIIECCHANAQRRPTFAELHQRFQKWCMGGTQSRALLTGVHYTHNGNGNRASSAHSAGSSSGAGGSSTAAGQQQQRGSRPPLIPYKTSGSSQLLRGSIGMLTEEFSNGSVPSPAPNSAANLTNSGSAGTSSMNGGSSAHFTKLAVMNNGKSIVHSTPIDSRSQERLNNGVSGEFVKCRMRGASNGGSGRNGEYQLTSDDDCSSNES